MHSDIALWAVLRANIISLQTFSLQYHFIGINVTNDIKLSIRDDIVDVNGNEYEGVVELDKHISKSVLSNPKRFMNYIKNNLIGLRIPVLDDQENLEMIEFAQAKETVRKGKNSHPVLGELAYMKGDIRKQVVVNAEEVIKVSIYDPVFSSTDNEHGWLDKNGWESRKAYVLAGDGMLYEAYLKIAKARDGRNILYTVNVDVKKGITVDQDATSKKAAVLAVTPSDKEDTTYSYKSQERDSDGNTLSKGQQEFFKDSKVRDSNGNLLVCYHGTDSKFNAFDENFISQDNKLGFGFYFMAGKKLQFSYKYPLKTYLNTFVSAVAIKLGYTSIIPTECGCEPMIDLFKKLGEWVESDSYTPKAGDVIFYDWEDSGSGDNKGYSDHVGIVEKVSGSTITVIEGNKNNAVERRTLQVNGKYIRRYGVPKYDTKSTNDYSDHWAKNAIQSMIDKKIMVGDGKGTFRPNANVTRGELAQALDSLLKYLGK